MIGPGEIDELRLADVETFLVVVRLGTIHGAARNQKVTASQVSKAIARLERHVGHALVARSARGVLLTEEGLRMVAPMTDLVARARSLRTRRRAGRDHPGRRDLSDDVFVAHRRRGAGALRPQHRGGAGLASRHISRQGSPYFEAALTTGAKAQPRSWASVRVGTVKKALYASPEAARRLGDRVTTAQLADWTFIGPIYSDRGQPVPGDDGCPLHTRRFGHRTQTVAAALELACLGPQLVFAPEIAARAFVASRKLVEIHVDGWNVREPLHFVCHQERVSAKAQRAIAAAMKAALRDDVR